MSDKKLVKSEFEKVVGSGERECRQGETASHSNASPRGDVGFLKLSKPWDVAICPLSRNESVNEERLPLVPRPPLDDMQRQVKQKIVQINTDLMHSEGLTEQEVKIAISLGLIDSDQAYFWTEEWQKGYREAQKDVEEGNYEVFKDTDSLLDYLHR